MNMRNVHLTFGGEGGFAVAIDPKAYARLAKERFVLLDDEQAVDAPYAEHGWVVVSGAHLVWATQRSKADRLVAVTRTARDYGVLSRVAIEVRSDLGPVTYDAVDRKAG